MNITVDNLSKRFGRVAALDGLSFTARPGAVTAFLGPNGAGKTTTLRILLGLVSAGSGTATIGGRAYRDLPHPTRTVGAVLDAAGFHPNHSARDHLRVYAAMGGHPDARVAELLDRSGLSAAADRPTRDYSTGMRRRLAPATALLGDPAVLVLDEPGNGLDPEGAVWLRETLRDLARRGRTVLVSSHVLAEVDRIADEVVVIRDGRLVSAGPADGDLEQTYLRALMEPRPC